MTGLDSLVTLGDNMFPTSNSLTRVCVPLSLAVTRYR